MNNHINILTQDILEYLTMYLEGCSKIYFLTLKSKHLFFNTYKFIHKSLKIIISCIGNEI